MLQIREVGNVQTLPDGTRLFGGGHRIVTLRVIEDFRTKGSPGSLIEVQTGMGGGDCGYTFKVGERYLVEVYESEGTYSTSICSRTAPEATAALTLRDLRAARSGTRFPDVSGSVIRYAAGQLPARLPEPMKGLPVTLMSGDRVVERVTTADDGVYAVDGLPPGQYSVRFELPSGIVGLPVGKLTQSFTIPDTVEGSALCKLSLEVQTAGHISGHIVDERGAPVKGLVQVFDRPVVGASRDGYVAVTGTGDSGDFDTGSLEDGDYWLYFRPMASGMPNVQAPTTLLSTGSVRLDAGKPVSNLTLVVRSPGP